MSESNKQELHNIVNLLPLDKWQRGEIEKKINLLPEEEAKRIASDLSGALSRLPQVLDEFNKTLNEFIKISKKSKVKSNPVSEDDKRDLAEKIVNKKVDNLELSGVDLSEANLNGANLSWANLSWANLSEANLNGANLSWANLSEANLSGANLSWANLSEANLSGAIVEKALFIRTRGIDEEQKTDLKKRGAIFDDSEKSPVRGEYDKGDLAEKIRPDLQPFEFDTVIVNKQGKVIQTETRYAFYFTELLAEDVPPLEMVAIPSGSFSMGSPEGEPERWSREGPQHQVSVSPFFISKYPITQEQWRIVAALPQVERNLNLSPSRFSGKNFPVEMVFWDDAVEFCQRLSNKTGRKYRLPTEAEWEYACRGGTQTPFHFGETISTDLANYDGNDTYGEGIEGIDRKQTTPVGYFKVANNFGLSDLHGNVWEWCEDDWHENYEHAPTDGSAWLSSSSNIKVVRGGSWCYNPNYSRSAFRGNYTRYITDYNFGFRVICVSIRAQGIDEKQKTDLKKRDTIFDDSEKSPVSLSKL